MAERKSGVRSAMAIRQRMGQLRAAAIDPTTPTFERTYKVGPKAGITETVRRRANQAAAVADAYTGGMLSAVAGLNPFGSYASVRAARDAALDDFKRDNPRLARDVLAPTEIPINPVQSVFIAGPAAANKLAKAKILHPDDKGGANRFAKAAEELVSGKSGVDEVWQEHGIGVAKTMKPG